MQEEDTPRLVSVLACGYEQVHIPKSGLSFPAWLVRVLTTTDDGSDTRLPTVLFVWRSKRDFWRLARKTKSQHFPKAAWTKLGDAAPWKRPDFGSHVNHEDVCIGYDLKRLRTQSLEDNWHPSMKKSLLQIDQFLTKVASEAVRHEHIREIWNDFVKGYPPPAGEKHFNSTSSPRVGNALGQYFCHPLNARQLVGTALLRLRRMRGDDHEPLVLSLVEPSCGHGQIVESLLQAVGSPDAPVSVKNFYLKAIDLDAHAIDKCRDKFGNDGDSVDFVCCDFLKALPNDSSSPNDKCVVVVVGGPPYTAGAGQGGSDESSLCRDLPMRFVRHAIDAYDASVVCYLMPLRCQRVDYVKEGWIPEHYEYESVQLEAPSVFFFQGTDHPVTQPSIIQCFWRRSV